MPLRTRRLAVLVALGLAALPAAANASTATIAGGDLTVAAGAAEANAVTIALAGDTITVTDGAGVTNGGGCVVVNATTVTCPESAVADDIVVTLADLDDTLAFTGIESGSTATSSRAAGRATTRSTAPRSATT